jgi:hypothetical protein
MGLNTPSCLRQPPSKNLTSFSGFFRLGLRWEHALNFQFHSCGGKYGEGKALSKKEGWLRATRDDSAGSESANQGQNDHDRIRNSEVGHFSYDADDRGGRNGCAHR